MGTVAPSEARGRTTVPSHQRPGNFGWIYTSLRDFEKALLSEGFGGVKTWGRSTPRLVSRRRLSMVGKKERVGLLVLITICPNSGTRNGHQVGL